MTPAKPIRVMIVDDHAVVRSGLTTFLRVFEDLVLAGSDLDEGNACRIGVRKRQEVHSLPAVPFDLDLLFRAPDRFFRHDR